MQPKVKGSVRVVCSHIAAAAGFCECSPDFSSAFASQTDWDEAVDHTEDAGAPRFDTRSSS